MSKYDFKIPQDGHIYINAIFDRCENLIHNGIWNGIHVTKLRRWLSNFNTDEERYFAACVLDNLIYRSEDQTIAMMKQLLQRTLPDLNRIDPMHLGPESNFEQILKIRTFPIDPKIRLVTVLRRTDPHSKSSPAIARFMKRKLFVDENFIIKPWEIKEKMKEGIKVFLFIDDFLGTGDQFEKFFIAEMSDALLEDAYFAYVPLTAHFKGIERLQNTYPNLRVTAVEVLDNTHSLFHPESLCFQDGTNNPKSAKKFYYSLLNTKNIYIDGPERRGFGSFELTYAFSHAVPDNCLPILWWAYEKNWYPLFDR